MGMSDYQMGYQAYFDGADFDETRTPSWQDGWLDAESEDLYSDNFDYYDDFGDY